MTTRPTPKQIIAGTKAFQELYGIEPYEEIVSRIHTAMTAAGWESMDSAPRDGTSVLAFDGNDVCIVSCSMYREEWTVAFDRSGQVFKPILWMHVPPPPKAIEP